MNGSPGETQLQATDIRRLQAIADAPNLVDQIDPEALRKLGYDVCRHFDLDEGSMEEWRAKMDRAIDLAMMVKGEKTYPWDNAANIKYPLITSAALQYNARAYPAIVPATDVVKVSVYGVDADARKANRAKRVSEFLSWQLKTDSREWERGTDQLTLQLPIVGDVFRKLWWDPVTRRIRSQIRLPGRHIVVNNNATSMATAPRVTDQIELYPYIVESYFRSGRFAEIEMPRRGEDDQEPEMFLEQLGRHDLDGDGYAEPYVVTVHKETQKVVRVVAAFDLDTAQLNAQNGQIVSIDHVPYMVHYQFMPSINGGFWGTGLGTLLGDISETVDATFNMLMDSGHLSSLSAGFIGAQDFRVKGGVMRLRPGEFKNVNFAGNDIRAGIVPMTFPGPSPVMFEMLGMLIQAGREIASVNDVMTGDQARQNMPVGTIMALIEQGQMVFTASYKRIYRAMQDEFELICRINARNLPPEKYMGFLEEQADPRADFDLSDMDIHPVADPNSVTSMQKMGKAQFLWELAQTGQINSQAALLRILQAASIENPEELLPQPDPAMMAMQAAQEELMMLEIRMKDAEMDDKMAQTMERLSNAQKNMTEVELAPLRARLEMLKASRDSLNARGAAIGRGNAGRVASAPRNAGGAGGAETRGGGEQVAAAISAMGAGAMRPGSAGPV